MIALLLAGALAAQAPPPAPLTTGALDDPDRYPPSVAIWTGEKIEWEALHPDLPKREGGDLYVAAAS